MLEKEEEEEDVDEKEGEKEEEENENEDIRKSLIKEERIAFIGKYRKTPLLSSSSSSFPSTSRSFFRHPLSLVWVLKLLLLSLFFYHDSPPFPSSQSPPCSLSVYFCVILCTWQHPLPHPLIHLFSYFFLFPPLIDVLVVLVDVVVVVAAASIAFSSTSPSSQSYSFFLHITLYSLHHSLATSSIYLFLFSLFSIS